MSNNQNEKIINLNYRMNRIVDCEINKTNDCSFVKHLKFVVFVE